MIDDRILPREFYLRDTLEVSKDLLGKELVHITDEGVTSGLIVEVEAYIGPHDKGSHAYNWKRTERTRIQYEIGGKAYIYQIYGMHFCFNVVTQDAGMPEVVLVRALQPWEGIEIMKRRRRFKEDSNPILLTNGPGKFCQAMAIDKSCYGMNLCESNLFIREPDIEVKKDIAASKRINIDYAGEAKDFDWRFFLRGNKYVSKA